MIPPLKIRISSPEKVVWEGEGFWVSSVNSAGPFDILPMHANFITIIENQTIHIKTRDGVVDYTFDSSIIYAHANVVAIYTNI